MADRTEQVLRELERLPRGDGSPRLAALRVAILFEDALGVVLTDADLDDPTLTADPAAFLSARSAF